MRGNLAVAAWQGVEGPSSVNNIRFKKTGSDISASIDLRVSKLRNEISMSEVRIKEICKRREVSEEEILGESAGETAQKVETYSTSNSDRYQGKSALEKFNADMQALRHEAYGIDGARTEIARLSLVKRNIEPDRSFDLSFDELRGFGF